MDPAAIAAIRSAVGAIGYMRVSPQEYVKDARREAFEIIGTGFLIGQRRLLTCAHVMRDLKSALRKRGLPPKHRMVQFVYPAGGTRWTTAFRQFKEREAQDDEIDLAVLDVGGLPLETRPAAIVSRADQPAVGEEIAMCGYPHGSVLLRQGEKIDRFGPIFQRGYIAALSPFDGPMPKALILDLVAAPASSGSPIVRAATGEVIGILVKGQEGRTAAISVAVPIASDGGDVIAWIKEPVVVGNPVGP